MLLCGVRTFLPLVLKDERTIRRSAAAKIVFFEAISRYSLQSFKKIEEKSIFLKGFPLLSGLGQSTVQENYTPNQH